MPENRGKDFEIVIKRCCMDIPGVSIDRLHDQTTGFLGSKNICDFVVYKKPYIYYIECKTVHGNLLPFTNISKNQWEGLQEKAELPGVQAGILCWWVEKDVTLFLPIDFLWQLKFDGHKSIRYDYEDKHIYKLRGKKKRVFFEYDMESFFREVVHG